MNRRLEAMNLMDYLFILKKHLRVILAVMAVLGIASFLVSQFLIPAKYSSSAQLIVKATQNTDETLRTYTDIDMSQKLVDTYAIIMKSEPVLTKVINALHLDLTTDALSSMISVNGVGTTEVMSITVTNHSPALAAQIANELTKVAPAVIMDAVDAGSVQVLSTAKVSYQRVFPKVPLVVALALLIGLVIGAAYAFLRELIDNTFKSDDDVTQLLGIPVLGVIPFMDTKNPGGNTGYRY